MGSSRLAGVDTLHLFNMFDTNEDGSVDANELVAGLSVLCRGSEDDKTRAIFDLYDEVRLSVVVPSSRVVSNRTIHKTDISGLRVVQ